MFAMAGPTRALFQRYAEFYSANIDTVFSLVEFFAYDFSLTELTVIDIFASSWKGFAKTEPDKRLAALYDTTYRHIRMLDVGPPPLRAMDRAPIEGEWSPLRPSDVHLGTSLLYASQNVSPTLDWHVLHLLVKTPITTLDWAHISQRTLEFTTRYLAAQQLSAHRSVLVAACELTGPECSNRPLLSHGAEPVSVVAHLAACTICNGFTELLVPTRRLISASAHTKLRPADRQRMLAAAISGPDGPAAHRSRWWTMQG